MKIWVLLLLTGIAFALVTARKLMTFIFLKTGYGSVVESLLGKQEVSLSIPSISS